MNEIDEAIRTAEEEYERLGTLTTSTFSMLTNYGLDAEAIMEDLRG